MTRVLFSVGIMIGVLADREPAVGQEESPISGQFASEPPDSLVRQLEPGPGFSVQFRTTAGEAPVGRWQLIRSGADERVFSDPAGLVEVTRGLRQLSESGFVLIDTSVANKGTKSVEIASASVADFSFRIAESRESLRFRPLTYREERWYDSTFWTGPDWTRVGRHWHHPGTNTPSVRRFTAPRDGRVTVRGRVFKLHQDGDGVRALILHRGRVVWQAEIEGKDGEGVEPDVALDVRRGESIRFVVHKLGQIYCDTTGWDPIVAYEDGERFQASESFAAKKQGAGGWSYEMQVDGPTDLGLPQLHTLGGDLAVRHRIPGVERAVEFTGQDALPLCFLADAADASGVVLAVAGAESWQIRSALTEDGILRLDAAAAGQAIKVEPGRSVQLPAVLLAPYRGPWLCGVHKLERLLESADREPQVAALQDRVARAIGMAAIPSEAGPGAQPDAASAGEAPELGLAVMVHSEWHQEDKLTEAVESYKTAAALHLAKAQELLADLRDDFGTGFLAAEGVQLERLAALANRNEPSLEDARSQYHSIRRLKRQIALANPLLDFGKLLFAKRVPTSYSHLVMQYYGFRARPGGGLFVLERPGHSLACRDILDGKLSGGNVLEPRLSYDGKRIVFSFVECEGKSFDPAKIGNDDSDEGFYHIYEVNVDGAGLRQLTSGSYDDLMPTYLPDGGIAFCSTRRRGYARCFGGQFSRRWDVYTLHRMDADGSNIRTLSFHDTNEWFPAVSNTGHILYARWDYIDRDAVTHQNLWASRPDGTNPVAVWGNATAKPHCTFQIQPIPNSNKIIFTAAAHHSIAAGPVTMVDPSAGNNGQEPITRITPEIPFPEAESRDIKEYYTAPWPLSEKYYLVAYSPKPLVWEPGANPANALGIYLLDKFGNRELIYRDPEIGSTNPCPLVPRPKPPVLASTLSSDSAPHGEMLLADVYQGLGEIPRGAIKELRIVQIFPKTTNVANDPPIGMAREENARAILGTVPVEPDGSARFLVPAGKPVLFQALDKDGFAYQTMRTVTYLQPGERVSCVGCHEHRMSAPRRPNTELMALRRSPSPIDPGDLGGRPFSYVEVVQPILDKHCAGCHNPKQPDGGFDLTGTPEGNFTKSYVALMGDVDFWGAGTNRENAARALVPRFGGRNQVQVTPPGGIYGALGSRLMKLLRAGHEDVELSDGELRRLAAWIDLNAVFSGAYLPEAHAAQLRGECLSMPDIQ
jgi:hypothetical protein